MEAATAINQTSTLKVVHESNWKDILINDEKYPIPELIDIVATEFNIEPDVMMTRTRKRIATEPRFMYISIAMDLVENAYPGPHYKGSKYCERITGWDHASILHAKKVFNNLIETSRTYRNHYLNIQRVLSEGMVQIPTDPMMEKENLKIYIYKLRTVVTENHIK